MGGGFVIAWQSLGASGYDVLGQRYASTGTPLGSNFRVNSDTAGPQFEPRLAFDRAGDFLAVWALNSISSSVSGRRFSKDGVPRDSDFPVDEGSGSAIEASVTSTGPDRFVVVWAQGQDVYARRLALPKGDANGDAVVDVGDVFYLINALFAGGPEPIGFADVDASATVDVLDVFYLINYLFAGGPAPV
jgi:hypothetical protein